jgi:hypothetical protein
MSQTGVQGIEGTTGDTMAEVHEKSRVSRSFVYLAGRCRCLVASHSMNFVRGYAIIVYKGNQGVFVYKCDGYLSLKHISLLHLQVRVKYNSMKFEMSTIFPTNAKHLFSC